MGRRGVHEAPCLIEEQLMDSWGGKVFFRDSVPQRLFSRDGPVTMFTEVALSGLSEFKTEHMELGRKKVEGGGYISGAGEEKRVVDLIKTQYVHY